MLNKEEAIEIRRVGSLMIPFDTNDIFKLPTLEHIGLYVYMVCKQREHKEFSASETAIKFNLSLEEIEEKINYLLSHI